MYLENFVQVACKESESFNYRNQYNPRNPLKEEGDRIMILEDGDRSAVA